MAEIRVAIMKMHKLKCQIAELEGQRKDLQTEVISTLGLKGVLEFNNLRCKIVQAFRRTVPWKKLAFGLAKKLFPEPADYRKWLKSVVHNYRKKASEPYALITTIQEKKKHGPIPA
jgi:hypothetical protein